MGNAVVEALTGAGAVVIGVDRAPKNDQEPADFYPLDITSEEQFAGVIQDTTRKHGRIDPLIHAAGSPRSPRRALRPWCLRPRRRAGRDHFRMHNMGTELRGCHR